MSEQSKRRFWQALLRVIIYMTPVFLISIIEAVYKGFPEDVATYALFLLFWMALVLISAFFHTRMGRMQRTLDTPLQFHLSTALVGTLSTSFLLWLNMRNRSGWPFDIRVTQIHYWLGGKEVYEAVDRVDHFCLMGDVFISFGLLQTVIALYDYYIRRPEAHKP